MANSKGTGAMFRTLPFTGKQSHLPPKSPLPIISPSYSDYSADPSTGSKGILKPRDGHRTHQRTSSESLLIEEQPTWLDELLNEPETPVRRGGHRRSSSDSFAYLESSNHFSNLGNLVQEEYKYENLTSAPSWGSLIVDDFREVRQASFNTEAKSFERKPNRGWESSLNSGSYPCTLPSPRDKVALRSVGPSFTLQEQDGLPSTSAGKTEQESGPYDAKGFSERKDGSHAKSPSSSADPKRAKQQFAQRSRVRKLQYIAELERNVQVLQAEGSEVAAELEFLDRQNLIMSMENNALKQRLDSLAQEHMIKYLEQEVLERELARLRVLLYQQQQPQQLPTQLHQKQPPPSAQHHRRSSSRDLDSQFANLSLKNTESSLGREAVGGPLRRTQSDELYQYIAHATASRAQNHTAAGFEVVPGRQR